MVRAWYMDNDPSDQRLEHHLQPPKFVSLDELFKITGVEYFKVKYTLQVCGCGNKCSVFRTA